MKFEDVKNNLNKKVKCKDKEGVYIFSACIVRKRKDGYYFQAELLDRKTIHSVFIVKLEDIQEIGGKE